MVEIPDNARFSPGTILRQLRAIRQAHRRTRFDLVHGWAARDWELTALAGRRLGVPALGTLHDHPRAAFIRPRRQWLMQSVARWGLRAIVCVSQAVADACREAGYPAQRLRVVRNGLEPAPALPWPGAGPFRFGFVGAFSARKGLTSLLAIAAELAKAGATGWELHVAGAALEASGEALMGSLRDQHAGQPWWSRVHWHGWVTDIRAFLEPLHVLVVPSQEFDPFPTVLLEAAQAGRPVLASRVGGAPEIVQDGRTGWLFPPGDARGAAAQLLRLLEEPETAEEAGCTAAAHLAGELTLAKMIAGYRDVYSSLCPDV